MVVNPRPRLSRGAHLMAVLRVLAVLLRVPRGANRRGLLRLSRGAQRMVMLSALPIELG